MSKDECIEFLRKNDQATQAAVAASSVPELVEVFEKACLPKVSHKYYHTFDGVEGREASAETNPQPQSPLLVR